MRNLTWLLVALNSLPAMALTNVDVYSTEVIVETEAPDADELARQQGMSQVLVRASGNKDIVSNVVVQKALSQSSRFISQLGYTQKQGQQALRLRFNSDQIQMLLKQAEQSTWPEERKNVMVWLVEDSGSERNIVWEHSDSPLMNELTQEAKRRGLPVTLPIGDFDDLTGVQTTDLWGGFVSPMVSATQRYPVDAIVVIRADSSGLRWTLYDQTPEQLLQSQLQPLQAKASGNDAMAQVIDQISDYYASQHASSVVSGESAGMITVLFNNMQDTSSFFKLERQLAQLASTAKAEVVEVRGDAVIVRVFLIGSLDSFKQELLKSNLVELESESVMAITDDSIATESTDGPSVNAAEPVVPSVEARSTIDQTLQTTAKPNTLSATTQLPVSDSDSNSSAGVELSSGLIAEPSLVFKFN